MLPSPRGDRVTFRYDGLDGRRRSTHVAFSEPATSRGRRPARAATRAGCRRQLHWELVSPAAARARWRSGDEPPPDRTARRRAEPPTHRRFPPTGDEARPPPTTPGARHDRDRPDHELSTCHQPSVADLRLLINDGPGPGERYVAAGVPWFTTLFGRDAIIAAFQSLAFRPQLAVETLDVLAALQATEVDDWRDAEPGKILHELRTGEMARTGELPLAPYYGSVDATPLWLILLAATFDWTGDRGLVDRLWPNALRALDWIDRLRRPRRRRVRRVRAPARRAGLRQPGLEGLERRDPRPARRDRRRADRAGRGPGLRVRREAPDGRPRPDRAATRPSRRGSSDEAESSGHGSRTRSGSPTCGYYAMALDGTAGGRRDRLQRRPVPVVRHRRPRARARRRRPA